MSSTSTKSDFVVAEEIKGLLDGRDKSEQERILRWVSESLGLSLAPPVSVAPLVAPAGAVPVPEVAHGARALDLRSFVAEKQPKSDMQFAATIAYYHRFIAPDAERKETITSDDLQTGARLANRKRFDTPSVPLNNAVANGYLDRAGRGEYRLNAVGENLVAMTLPGANGESGSARVRRKRNSKKTKATKRKG